MTAHYWLLADKYDPRCLCLADRHYTRQTPGSAQFCRPGYNLVLHHQDDKGHAVFVWWRPRWDVGRKDGLRAIECTIFRNESAALSSSLITDAVAVVQTWLPSPHEGWHQHADVELITGVGAEQTAGRRSKRHLPGHCFRAAGWVEMDKASTRAGLWLRCPNIAMPPLRQAAPADRGQISLGLEATP